eukprot:1155323-Pelagomonas_calceolata.AAC.1
MEDCTSQKAVCMKDNVEFKAACCLVPTRSKRVPCCFPLNFPSPDDAFAASRLQKQVTAPTYENAQHVNSFLPQMLQSGRLADGGRSRPTSANTTDLPPSTNSQCGRLKREALIRIEEAFQLQSTGSGHWTCLKSWLGAHLLSSTPFYTPHTPVPGYHVCMDVFDTPASQPEVHREIKQSQEPTLQANPTQC